MLAKRSGRLHTLIEVVALVAFCVLVYVARVVTTRIVADILEEKAPDVRGAIALSMRLSTFRLSLSLMGRILLWSPVAVAAGLVLYGVAHAAATAAHYQLPHGAMTRPIVWTIVLVLDLCFARYSFAIPYLAFTNGSVAKPISLSVIRSKPILRPVRWLVVCESVVMLTISRIFLWLDPEITKGASIKHFLWGVVRDGASGLPTAWFLIAMAMLAYADFVAMKSGSSLSAWTEPEIELIDGLPAYQPPIAKPSL